MTKYWEADLFIYALGGFICYCLVRIAQDAWHYRKQRRMAPYAQTWGSVNYMGQHRQNFRRP